MKTKPNKTTHNNNTVTNCIFSATDRKRLKKLLSKDSFDELMQLHEADKMPSELFDATGQKIPYCSMEKISINSWEDGHEEYIYQIGNRVYAYYDHRGDFFVYEENDVTCVIEYSYPWNEGYWEEKCVQFEVKPPLRPAKRSCSGFCRVWINTFYRDAHLRAGDLSGWVREANGEIIEFESYSAARKWINQDKKEHHGYPDIQYPKGHYMYCHNEYAPRNYKICH